MAEKIQFSTQQQNITNPNPTKKKSGCLKWMGIGFLVIAFFYGVGKCLGSNEGSSTQVSKEKNKTDTIKKDPIVVIDNLIKSINDDKDPYKDSIERVNMYLVLFKGFGQIYSQYENSKDSKVQAKLSELKKTAGKYQSRLLPKMRKTYVNTVKEKLWRSNIDVQSLGGNITTIQFTGGTLANNANKEDLMNTISEMVNNLRFKKVNMKWYKYDDEYTYYDLKNPNDSEIYK
ncbi:hypothetical protein ACTZET_06125 [Elizabethkingia anophelis]|uniref:hypothetical protein n=1 Tax=Elizabethkingia anophelis TaxID=1117645 RepID=UPI004029D780